jgi:chromosome segregation ATPase
VGEQLDATLTARLREALRSPATESELRSLCEQADGWARALQAQIEASERRLRELTEDPSTSLTEITAELRRVETLAPELSELRTLLAGLDDRARELRTEWLRHQMSSLAGGQ